MLDEREFELVNIVGSEVASSQRDLSHHMNLSLGQTNMLLRRLITKGYIRISQLDKRKVQYLLTPKGFSEKMQKSIKYTLKTINSISLIKDKIKEKIQLFYEQGERKFIVIGKSDLAMMIDMAIKEMNIKDYSLEHVEGIPQEKIDGVFLICKENVMIDKTIVNHFVDFIHELASDRTFFNSTNSREWYEQKSSGDTQRDTASDTVSNTVKLSANQKKVLSLIVEDTAITAEVLSHKVGINIRNMKSNIAVLKEKGLLKRIGPDKGGHWEVVERWTYNWP